MNRIARRTGIVFLFALLLLSGIVFFLWEYGTKASQWALFPGNPHLYNGTNIGCGKVLDRDGQLLLDMTDGQKYSTDMQLRESTVHWLGDRDGYVSAPAVASHTEDLVGYSIWNGLYSYSKQIGGNAKLTISGKVQKAAVAALGDYKGTVAVYNYKTGEILCAVSKPGFDPDNVPVITEENEDKYDGMYVNRFIQSTYTPGSIFKIVPTVAALETLDDAEELVFYCDGEYAVGSDKVTCEQQHGSQTLSQAMCNSCNCAYAQLAEKLGAEVLTRYADQLKITEPVEFDGITTAQGQFDIINAEQVEMDWAAIGQYTDLINPCRFMLLMGAIANDGQAAVPYVVKDITVNGRQTYSAQTIKEEPVMDAETAGILKEYMRSNVVDNYGDYYFPGLTVCAKSGTSQSDGDDKPSAMFVGFVTDEKYPLAFVMIVEDGGYGGTVCPPIMGQILAVCKSVMDR